MDHSVANIMEPKNNQMLTNSILSEFTTEQRQNSLGKNENLMHNKEQNLQSKYYKNIKEVLKGHKEVLLFGPTTAKDELLNLLKTDHHFEGVKIEVKSADKMTENQQHAFVKEFFQVS